MSTEMPQTRDELKKLTLPVLRGFAHDRKIPEKQKKDDLIDSLLDWVADNDEELDDDELDDEVDDTEGPSEMARLADAAETLTDEVEKAIAEDDDEVDDTPKKATPPEPVGETLTAKQVATRIGTDAKVLRKFFRSPASTVEAVGQGGRYEFAKTDLDKIKQEFETWQSGNKARGSKRSSGKAPAPTRADTKVVEEVDDELELDDELEDTEPTAADLEDLELEQDDDDELED